jgi:hypothetical protein
MSQLGWTEVFEGGSPDAESVIFAELAERMHGVQEANRRLAGAPHSFRTLHAKQVVGVTNATLQIDEVLPPHFAASHIQPGAALNASVRLSNASGTPQPDGAADMRGAALRIRLPRGGVHDLLMTSFPVSHARNARQFVDFAVIASGDRATMQPRLIERFGPEEATRMIANIRQGVRQCRSFATESFWSRGAFLWGSQPVRFQLRPSARSCGELEEIASQDGLFDEFRLRVLHQDVVYRLALQAYVAEDVTPIEDGSVEWTEEVSAPVEIATLTLPMQDLSSSEGLAAAAAVDDMAFNPWNAPPEFRPLGNLNRARAGVYARSAKAWQRSSATAAE